MLWLVPLTPLLAAPLLYGLCRDGGHARLAALAPAGVVFALSVPLVAAPIALYAAHHETQPPGPAARARLMALLLVFVGAMQLLVLAADLLTLLIAWELVGALSWALIGHDWRERGNLRDAGWAFLVTRFGDLGLYIAAAAAFAGSGSLAFSALAELKGMPLQVCVAGILLACAAKSAQLPFAPWLFAAMSGPTSVSALLHAATMVAAGVYLIIRLQPSLDAVAWFAPLAMALGLATALAGGLVAGLQGHAKKLLAASTSAHHGLMWLAVGAGYPGAALLHFVVHAFFKAGLFLASGIAQHQVGSYALGAMRLGRRLPGIAAATLIGSLALAGIPPLVGFFSKFMLYRVALDGGLGWLALVAALNTAASLFYYLRVAGKMVFAEPSGPPVYRLEGYAAGSVVWLGGMLLVIGGALMQWLVGPLQAARTLLFMP